MTALDFLQNRLAAVRSSLKGADALLVSNIINVRYLTGFTGSAGFAIVSKKEALFLTDSRYGKDALGEAGRLFETVILKGAPEKAIARLCRRLKIKKLSFERTVSYGFYEKLRRALGPDAVPAEIVEGLRAVKDGFEIECLKAAVKRAEDAFNDIKGRIRPGITEKALASRLEEAILREGSLKPAFPSIVASGENSAIPHARPSGRRIAPGDLVVIDWGAEYEGYFSDMTRTFLIAGGGARLAEKKKIYRTVLKAQNEAMAFVRRFYSGGLYRGKSPKEIDNSARYVIKQAGYGEHFEHSLGHGIGLEVHERPGISPRSAQGKRKTLARGTVFTIEPGIYVPGLGGVRIEDMVCLGPDQPELLTHLPKAGFLK